MNWPRRSLATTLSLLSATVALSFGPTLRAQSEAESAQPAVDRARELDLAFAKHLMAAGETVVARLRGPGGAIAIVDAGGHLVLLERLDGTFPAAATVSTEKARTAALFRMPTANLENAIKNGRIALLGVDRMTPLTGGVPIRLGDRVIGAVGVSGAASAAQDTEIAEAIAGAAAEAARATSSAALDPLMESPLASIDLTTEAGAALVKADWRHARAEVVETMHRAPDAEGQPTGAPTRTRTIVPRAGALDFDDSRWPSIAPATLADRRGTGRLDFNWYRTRITIPERIGDFDPTGSTLIFEATVDDYAEVWIDGELARAIGQRGGSVVSGWNASNRVLAKRGVRPGQTLQIALFGANGPLSDPPANFIWVRSAKLEFVASPSADPVAILPAEVNVEVERLDPRLDAVLPANTKLWKLAEGFQFTEGPLWLPDRQILLFSDPNANRIYEYAPAPDLRAGSLRVFLERSGYAGADIAEYTQPGSNGLAFDPIDHRLTLAEHGRRRISAFGSDGTATTRVDRFEGKRLNSPNDLVFRSDGTLYFSDPPFGLPKAFDDPRKELATSGVYALRRNGALELVTNELAGPNGVAFSPDELFLYVTNWDEKRKVVMRYPIDAAGRAGEGSLFFDMTNAAGAEALDGLKVDRLGNLYVSGPGGLWILAPDGTHLGTLRGPRLAANLAWGEDGRTLFLTARDGLYMTRLLVAGAGHPN